MATVSGKTSPKIDELIGETIVGAELDSQGTLTFERKNGQEINAGSIGGSIISAAINGAKRLIFTRRDGTTVDAGSIETNLPIQAWPVGSIFMTASATNPATLLGGGTWARWGQGRVPVSLDSTQTEFDAVEETGGSKSETITADQLPKHKHAHPHTHSMTHNHQPPDAGDSFLVSDPSGGDNRANGPGYNAVGSGTTGGSSRPDTGQPSVSETSENVTTNAPVNNLQPYITCYMWKRTA